MSLGAGATGLGEPWGVRGSEQGEQSSGGREGRLFSQAAFLAGSLETRERLGKVSAGARAAHRTSAKLDAERDLMGPDQQGFEDLQETDASCLHQGRREALSKGKGLQEEGGSPY